MIRVATRDAAGWTVHPWIKQAILLYFALRPMERTSAGPLSFQDKIPIKTPPDGVRIVPPGTVRYGAYVAPGAIVMPGYVNIGAYVDSGSMVDTWATVGSCAQIGRDVHLAGGVGVTLTAATQVVFNDLDWVPANHWQAEDRAYRIGQTGTVNVSYLVATDTVDEFVRSALQVKALLVDGQRMVALDQSVALGRDAVVLDDASVLQPLPEEGAEGWWDRVKDAFSSEKTEEEKEK